MQPPETGPTPSPVSHDSGTGPAPVAAPPQRNRRRRLVLALAAGVLFLLCLGGAGVLVALYDGATKIDRTTPDTVTDSFLIAYLVNRDDTQAELFTCDQPNLAAIAALRSEMIGREKSRGVSVSVSWGALSRAPAGDGQEDVTTTLTISGSADGRTLSSRDEEWVFRVVEDDGSWRLCGAAKRT